MRFLIAAGGSGGHLIPAVLIADAIRRESSAAEIEFIGSGRPLEVKIVSGAGYDRHVVSMSGVKSGGVRAYLRLARLMPQAFLSVWRIISRFQPDLVLGVGGYASFVPVTVAAMRGIPTWIHEADIEPGIANRVLAHYAGTLSTAFPDLKIASTARAVYTGQPVRPELRDLNPAAEKEPKQILITGGSQGARSLDESAELLATFFAARKISVRHQCRPESLAVVSNAYNTAGAAAVVEPFISDMTAAYAASDLVISRAGATTVMEISVINRPAILVPYPHAKGHQRANAAFLGSAGKALVVEEGEGFSERLLSALSFLLDPVEYNEMKGRPFTAPSLSAAEQIARGCLAAVE